MNAVTHLQLVLVDPGRWHGIQTALPADVLIDDLPPVALVVIVREVRHARRGELPIREGVVNRDRAVLCRYVAEIGDQVFYSPVPGQHADDESWPDAVRSILAVERGRDVS